MPCHFHFSVWFDHDLQDAQAMLEIFLHCHECSGMPSLIMRRFNPDIDDWLIVVIGIDETCDGAVWGAPLNDVQDAAKAGF